MMVVTFEDAAGWRLGLLDQENVIDLVAGDLGLPDDMEGSIRAGDAALNAAACV